MENERKKDRLKKILRIGIPAVVLIAVVIWAIQVIPIVNYYKEEWMDAERFVSEWNKRSKEDDPLTGGIKISDAAGDHAYELKNGATLRYSVDTYWWVSYMTANVVLEFPEENRDNVYEMSELFLEVFKDIEDKNGVFEQACTGIDRNMPMMVERFSVGLDWESREPYATFVEAKVLPSGPLVGYSWNLTLEEWCENYNKNLDSALQDAAQHVYESVAETESGEVSTEVKDGMLAYYRERHTPIYLEDFVQEAVLTDGEYEYEVYACYRPNRNECSNKIFILVDENGYISECECLTVKSLYEMVDLSMTKQFFMDFAGYPILTCAATGTSYTEAKNGYFNVGDSVTTSCEVTKDVYAGFESDQSGVFYMFVPNREGAYENYTSISDETWTSKPTK